MEQEALNYLESSCSQRFLHKYLNLSPYFCFRYLYDLDESQSDNWTSYDEVISYLKKQGITDKDFIEKEYQRAMKDRNQ